MKKITIILLFINLLLFFTNCKKSNDAQLQQPATIKNSSPYDNCKPANSTLYVVKNNVDSLYNQYNYAFNTSLNLNSVNNGTSDVITVLYDNQNRIISLDINDPLFTSLYPIDEFSGHFEFSYDANGKINLRKRTMNGGIKDSSLYTYSNASTINIFTYHFVNNILKDTVVGRIELDNNGNILKEYKSFQKDISHPNQDTLTIYRDYQYVSNSSPIKGFSHDLLMVYLGLNVLSNNLLSSCKIYQYNPYSVSDMLVYEQIVNYTFDAKERITEAAWSTPSGSAAINVFGTSKVKYSYACQ